MGRKPLALLPQQSKWWQIWKHIDDCFSVLLFSKEKARFSWLFARNTWCFLCRMWGTRLKSIEWGPAKEAQRLWDLTSACKMQGESFLPEPSLLNSCWTKGFWKDAWLREVKADVRRLGLKFWILEPVSLHFSASVSTWVKWMACMRRYPRYCYRVLE